MIYTHKITMDEKIIILSGKRKVLATLECINHNPSPSTCNCYSGLPNMKITIIGIINRYKYGQDDLNNFLSEVERIPEDDMLLRKEIAHHAYSLWGCKDTVFM